MQNQISSTLVGSRRSEASDVFTSEDVIVADRSSTCQPSSTAQDRRLETGQSSGEDARSKRQASQCRRKSPMPKQDAVADSASNKTALPGTDRKVTTKTESGDGKVVEPDASSSNDEHNNDVTQQQARSEGSPASDQSAEPGEDNNKGAATPHLNGTPAPQSSADLTTVSPQHCLQVETEDRRRKARDYVKAQRALRFKRMAVESAVIAAMLDDGGMSLERLHAEQAIAADILALELAANAMKQTESKAIDVLLKYSEKFMRLSQKAIVDRHKMQGGVKQHVTVQHLNVNDGGNAMVAGQVTQRKGGAE